MAKLTLNDIADLQNENSAVTAINYNNSLIEDAVEKTLTRTGTSPNSMSTNLDMNSFRIINLPEPTSSNEPARLIDIPNSVTYAGSAAESAATATEQAAIAVAAAASAEAAVSAASVTDGVIVNGTLVCSVSSSALTIALKTSAGSDPSSGSPVTVNFKGSSTTTGSQDSISVEAATSLVISSGSTLGTTSAIPFRIWVVGFNDGGTFKLGVINCKSSTGLVGLDTGASASSTAEGGAGSADSAGVFYTGTAVSSKIYCILGSFEYQSGLATAGTWSGLPTLVRLFGNGQLKPGEVKQVKIAISTTPTVNTVTSYTDTSLAVTIPVSNPCNLIAGSWNANMQLANSAGHYGAATAYRSATQVGSIAVHNIIPSSGAPIMVVSGQFLDFPGASGDTTYTIKTKAGTSGQNVTLPYNSGEAANGVIQVVEFIA